MDFEDFEISFREVLICIAITLSLVGLGFLVSETIKDSINEKNEKYYKALKVDNDEEMFKYAIKTNIGYTLAQGRVQAVEGVSIEDIEDTYFRIRKVTEKYTQHFRQVEHTTTKADGTTETYYTTEEYWTWDYVGEEEWHTEKFNFLGVNFEYGTIEFHNESYKETKDGGYHIRYKYYTIPFEFEGTLFTYIQDNTINESTFSINNSIEEIIELKKKSVNTGSTIFWIIWLMFIGIIDLGYVYMDNNYLYE